MKGIEFHLLDQWKDAEQGGHLLGDAFSMCWGLNPGPYTCLASAPPSALATFETGSLCVAQAGLNLLILLHGLPSAKITGVPHHTY
jgi:hypothetical protein